jgi:hypothetical protein
LRLPPQGRYSLKGDDTGDWYEIYSYSEAGTVSVIRSSGRDALRAIPTGPLMDDWVPKRRGEPLWRVVGLSPDDLTPIEPEL